MLLGASAKGEAGVKHTRERIKRRNKVFPSRVCEVKAPLIKTLSSSPAILAGRVGTVQPFNLPMRLALLQSIRAMLHDITAHEALADRLDRTAAEAYDQGELGKAHVLRLLVRQYRIRAMNMRGNLEIALNAYRIKHQSDPWLG